MSSPAGKRQSVWERMEAISNIYFAKGTWRELDLREEEKIDELARMLKADPETDVTLTGHASEEGTRDGNLKLSTNRAMKVKTLLTAKGANPQRISVKGVGSSMPAVTETGRTPLELENQRKFNRRVYVAFSFVKQVFDVRQFILNRARRHIEDILAGKRVVPWPTDPPPRKQHVFDVKRPIKPDEWRAIVKEIQDALEVRGVKFDPEKIAEVIKEGLQLPTPDNQGPFDEDFEKDQRQRQSPPSQPEPPD